MSASDDVEYGRTGAEWDRLAAAGTKFLVERAKLEKVTSYTEMNSTLAQRTGLPQLDFDRQDERSGMGLLLGRIVDATYPTTGVMLSALVHHLDANDVGPGFYTLAQRLELLPRNASRDAKEAFWVGQVRAVHDHYRTA